MENFYKIYTCTNCGICITNRKDWCDLGCGSDYNEMLEIKNFKQFFHTYIKEKVEEMKGIPACDVINGKLVIYKQDAINILKDL